MPTINDNTAKIRALCETGTLNPTPEKVADPKFRESEFFDPHDIIQVRYEMLRRVLIEKSSVTNAVKEYGISRPTFYQAMANFDERGLAGLVPRKPGPRAPHKLSPEILAFLNRNLEPGQPMRARHLALLVRQAFDLDVHPRSIERALGGKKIPR